MTALTLRPSLVANPPGCGLEVGKTVEVAVWKDFADPEEDVDGLSATSVLACEMCRSSCGGPQSFALEASKSADEII